MSFIHLRCHTSFSLLEGAIAPSDLAKLAQNEGMPALGICDTDNLFGVLESCEKLLSKGIQPVVGSSLKVQFDEDLVGEVGFIVRSEQGYLNLLSIMSDAYLDGDVIDGPIVPLAQLEGKSEGLFFLSGNHAGIGHKLLERRQLESLEHHLLSLAGFAPSSLFVEIQRIGRAGEGEVEQALLDFAYKHSFPLVATNDIFYDQPEAHDAHDALRCIARGEYVEDGRRDRLAPCHYFRGQDEMAELFSDLPEALENSVLIASSCGFFPKEHPPILPRFVKGGVEAENDELAQQAWDGLNERLAHKVDDYDSSGYDERMKHELAIIQEKGFSGYFLIVADFIKWAKAKDIPVGPGRGSGAGSLVAWALTITDLDPLAFGLLFERFLNPERRSMPDFDIDFCQDRRDEVISYVQERYGRDEVAQIITFGKLQARAVLRDVGRVIGMPYGQVDRICKLVPNNPANPVTLQEALDSEDLLRVERDRDDQSRRLFDISLQLEGLYRHASTHAAGVVIGDRPLKQLIPLYRDPKSDMPVTQFNMNWAERAGLVKFDFLGLKTLTVIKKAVSLIRFAGHEIDVDNLPMNDPKTFAMLGEGHSTGVFQLESAGMRDVLRKMKPDCLEDLIALVALYRPGPMDNIPRYIDCKAGRAEPDYLHPVLEPILQETYGVIIYQEQVMQIAQTMSGYSLGEADLLRRAMGKKKKDVMEQEQAKFIQGAQENNIDTKQARYIFTMVEKFAGYGFNKSHAAAYAYVAYQTAYLKANHPLEFLAALMTLDMGNTEKLSSFRDDVLGLGFSLLPPDINKSFHDFAPEEGAIRYALGAVRNVGSNVVHWIVGERDAHGPFADMADFIKRLDTEHVNKRAFEFLVKSGAFDSLHPSRAALLGSIDGIFAEGMRRKSDMNMCQGSMFGDEEIDPMMVVRTPAREFTSFELLDVEQHALGFFLSGHPLDAYADQLSEEGATTFSLLEERAKEKPSRGLVAGMVVSMRELSGSRGKFGIVKLSDRVGGFEVAVFSEVWEKSRSLVRPGEVLFMMVQVEDDEGRLRVRAESLRNAEQQARKSSQRIEINIDKSTCIKDLRQLLEPGRCEIFLRLHCMKNLCDATYQLPGSFAMNMRTRQAIAALHGVRSVEER